MKTIDIVLFCSGDFPYYTIKRLISEKKYRVKGIVTSLYKTITGKENIINISKNNNIPYYVIKSNDDIKNDVFKEWLYEKNADIFCVISFKYLPQSIITIPSITSFNIHASMLPFLRGAAPINWAIRNGFKETGLTSFVLNSKIDCGDIIGNIKEKILPDDNFGTLFERLSKLCADFTCKTIDKLSKKGWENNLIGQPSVNSISDVPQLFAPKLTSDNSKLRLNATDGTLYTDGNYVYDIIRSMAPYYGCECKIKVFNDICLVKEYDAKIYNAKKIEYKNEIYLKWNNKSLISNIITDGKTFMYIMDISKRNFISIEEIQIIGRKRLNIADFLSGFQIARNNKLSIRIE